MGYQNFFATRLFTDIGAADTTITLENPPAVTSGRLVLEARNTSKREIISYTGVSGNDITGVTRGVGGTSATDHTKNSLVEMNVVAEDLSDALAVPSDIITRFDEVISDHVASGLVVTDDTGLTADISAGVAYINGIRLDVAADLNHAFTASKDTYVDLGDNGVLDYNEVANNAAAPAIAASHIRLAMVRTNATDTTAIILYSNPSSLIQSNGWQGGLPPVSSVTHNGNRSYTVSFASTVASILSEGMRLEFTKTVAGNGYMGGAFNGSSHYFTKTSPSGTLGTVTNNFTIEAVVQPTSYAQGYICGRMDATPNNGFGVVMEADGRVRVQIFNAGVANARSSTTYQSLPLNKKTHVAVTWQGGTAYLIYFDGVAVPVAASTSGGTNPTTAGTGGDFSIGRTGSYASSYFPGYISNAAVFDAVLSQATILDHATRKLTGSETNCIGAWSLDNTANDQSSAGNNLTAQGGVGYTAMSPHGQLGNGVETTKAVGLVTNVNGTTVTVQCPEGVTIPSGSSTISAVAYSTQANPFGFVSDKGRWELSFSLRAYVEQVTPVSGTIYNIKSLSLITPAGKWKIGCLFGGFISFGTAGTYASVNVALSKSSSAFTSDKLIARNTAISVAVFEISYANNYVEESVEVSTATTWYLIYSSGFAGGGVSGLGRINSAYITITPSNL